MDGQNEVSLAPNVLWVRPFLQMLTSLTELRLCGALPGASAWCAWTMPVKLRLYPWSLGVFLVRHDPHSTSPWGGSMRRMLISVTKPVNYKPPKLYGSGRSLTSLVDWHHYARLEGTRKCSNLLIRAPKGAQMVLRSAQMVDPNPCVWVIPSTGAAQKVSDNRRSSPS